VAETELEPPDSAYPDRRELEPASADSAYPDTSELDPGIAAFVEAVGAVEAPETAAPPAPTTSSASSYSSRYSVTTKYSVTPIVAALRRNEVDAALGDFGQLSTSFRASFTPTGLRIDAVQPGSLLAKAGFAVGDVITIVDGKPLRTIDDAADLYARAWTTSSSTVQVIRAKQPLTVRIAIQ
jgi:membrane-associated protease RseP (regulator of RpoE activity)